MKVSRLFGVLLPAVLLLAACAPAAPELNLYAWSEYVPQELLDNFTAKTGIKVNYDTYSSNEEMLAKLQAGASGYDLVIPTDYTVDVMIKQGLIEPIDLTKIPNFGNIDPQFADQYYDPGNKYSVPYMWGTTALAYESTKVPFEPKSWADLWDPAFENQLVVLDDSREVPGMALMVLGYDKNSVSPQELEEAKQKLIALKPNIKLFDSDVPESALLTGEASAGLVYNGNAAIGHSENENIMYICPVEGCTLWIDNFVTPKGAPHKDAAMAFIDFALDPVQSVIITANFPYSNPNAAALEYMKTNDPDAYATYMDYPATNPSAEFLGGASPTKDVGEATTLYDELWTDFKGE
jgi:spermidine/putrescine-binding protein